MAKPVTKNQIILAQIAVALIVGFAGLGLALNGFSGEVRERIWQNLLDRPGGPMTFRFILQPVMASIAALIDGIRDARAGSSPYLATMIADPAHGYGSLRQGLIATSRIILLGVAMDIIYQFIEFGTFFPGEAAIVAVLLAFIPYLLLRGPFARLAKLWLGTAANR